MTRFITIIIFLICTSSLSAQARQLITFEELMASLKSGGRVRAVIHYSKAVLVSDGDTLDAPDAIGGMELSTFEYFAKMTVRNELAFLSCSETVLISHPYYGHVYNYAKLRIYENNKAEIVARYLDPLTMEVKMDETFYTYLNNGQNEGGLFIFK